MHFIPEEIDDYVVSHSESEPELLQKLTRETYQKILQPRMLSGHYQGRVLSMISKLINPKNILEIGTYTGYSAIALSKGLQKGGKLISLEFNQEHESMAKSYFEKSEKADQIEMIIGNAIDIIPTLNYKWDLVFIDADKTNYSNYFDLVIDSLPSGSWILADNVLWSGKVTETPNPKDEDTIALIAYNKMMNEDPRIETVLLPIRDGLTISRVK